VYATILLLSRNNFLSWITTFRPERSCSVRTEVIIVPDYLAGGFEVEDLFCNESVSFDMGKWFQRVYSEPLCK
jgi:hypothetical protein